MEQLCSNVTDGSENTTHDGGSKILGNPESNCTKYDYEPRQSDDNRHGGIHQKIEVGEASRDEVVHDDNVQCNQHSFFLQVIVKMYLCQRQLAIKGINKDTIYLLYNN